MAALESNGVNVGYEDDEVDDLPGEDVDQSPVTSCSQFLLLSCVFSLDNLPRHIITKIFSFLDISDLISLESMSRRTLEHVTHFWKTYCQRYKLAGDPTPLCVGWKLNQMSLYSYDSAVALCKHPVKKWRLLAVRCFLRDCYRCVICCQHLKDRNSVDGFYFKHDVLLCYPQCYEIFTLNFQLDMV